MKIFYGRPWRRERNRSLVTARQVEAITGGLQTAPGERKVEVVPATGLDPVRCYSLEHESSASANSATGAARGCAQRRPRPGSTLAQPFRAAQAAKRALNLINGFRWL